MEKILMRIWNMICWIKMVYSLVFFSQERLRITLLYFVPRLYRFSVYIMKCELCKWQWSLCREGTFKLMPFFLLGIIGLEQSLTFCTCCDCCKLIAASSFPASFLAFISFLHANKIQKKLLKLPFISKFENFDVFSRKKWWIALLLDPYPSSLSFWAQLFWP